MLERIPFFQLAASFILSLVVKVVFLAMHKVKAWPHALAELVVALVVTPLALYGNWRMGVVWFVAVVILDRIAVGMAKKYMSHTAWIMAVVHALIAIGAYALLIAYDYP